MNHIRMCIIQHNKITDYLSLKKYPSLLRSTPLHTIALHIIALHNIALHTFTLHTIALHTIALHTIALHTIALRTIALHTIALLPSRPTSPLIQIIITSYHQRHPILIFINLYYLVRVPGLCFYMFSYGSTYIYIMSFIDKMSSLLNLI